MDVEEHSEMKLPGFRFHPTEEELLTFYLKSAVFTKKLHTDIIGFLNIYNYDPKDLPGLAKIGEREWYFFVPRDRKQGSGGRPNRTTEQGFWKATGSDRKIVSMSDPKKVVGLKKTLVFYQGRAPYGSKTHWVMNEYRLPDNRGIAVQDIVLCKIYMKATSLKVLQRRAAMEEEEEMISSSVLGGSPCPTTVLSMDDVSSSSTMAGGGMIETQQQDYFVEHQQKQDGPGNPVNSSRVRGIGKMDVQVPKLGTTEAWAQDSSFWTQLSPWLDTSTFTPFFSMC